VRAGVVTVIGGKDDDRILRDLRGQGVKDQSDILVEDRHDLRIGIEASCCNRCLL